MCIPLHCFFRLCHETLSCIGGSLAADQQCLFVKGQTHTFHLLVRVSAVMGSFPALGSPYPNSGYKTSETSLEPCSKKIPNTDTRVDPGYLTFYGMRQIWAVLAHRQKHVVHRRWNIFLSGGVSQIEQDLDGAVEGS